MGWVVPGGRCGSWCCVTWSILHSCVCVCFPSRHCKQSVNTSDRIYLHTSIRLLHPTGCGQQLIACTWMFCSYCAGSHSRSNPLLVTLVLECVCAFGYTALLTLQPVAAAGCCLWISLCPAWLPSSQPCCLWISLCTSLTSGCADAASPGARAWGQNCASALGWDRA
jgi:hypothetical protein